MYRTVLTMNRMLTVFINSTTCDGWTDERRRKECIVKRK